MNKTDTANPRKCIVLLSGGIDSAACLDMYLRNESFVNCLHVQYGQRAARQELDAATAIASHYDVPLTVIRHCGDRQHHEGEVVGRNAFFVMTALVETGTPSSIVMGIHTGSPYFDCSSHFVALTQQLLDSYCDGRTRFSAPLIDWTKQDIWSYCSAHGVPVGLTYSCEHGGGDPCGECLSCKEWEGFDVCKK